MASTNCPSNPLRQGQSGGESRLSAASHIDHQRWNLITPGVLLLLLGWMISDSLLSSSGGESWQAARLEAYLNGLFLILLGVLWPRLALPLTWRRTLYKAILYGTWLKWAMSLGTNLYAARAWLAFDGTDATAWLVQQRLLDLSLLCLSCALVAITLYLVLGLRRRDPQPRSPG